MKLNNNAQEILEARYLQKGEQTWNDVTKRIALVTNNENFGTIINDMLFIPAGRILRNLGRKQGSLFNCYLLPIGDSREEIGECMKNALILWGEGGGIGINFSSLRPMGAEIKGVGGESSGLVSFMRAIDGIAATVQSGGQRRAASLGLCEVSHPEVAAFANCKWQDGNIKYFNISIGVSNPFIEAVQQHRPYDLHFNRRVYKTVKAEELWDTMVRSMIHNGDPGLINMSNLIKNNSYYFAPVKGTNPCGEACLEENGVCNLGSLVLPNFRMGTRFNWSKLEETIHSAVHFLDYCIDLNVYSLPQIKQTAQKARRIGLGVMGLADLLVSRGLVYGSENSLVFIERLFKFIRNVSYEASIKLAEEKGTFPEFDSHLYHKASFIRKLPASLRTSIRQKGIRNVTVNAIAPTGTISLIPECISSIEPIPYLSYIRNDRVSTRTYIYPEYRRYLEERSVHKNNALIDSTVLQPSDHLEVQSAIQKYVDGAVSKTILLPKSFKAPDLSELLLEYIFDLKGVTVYRDGSRKGQVLNPLTKKQTMEYIKSGNDNVLFPETGCDDDSCGI